MPPLLITSETAREYQRRSAIAQREKAAIKAAIPKPVSSEELTNGQLAKRIARTEKQWDLIDGLLEQTTLKAGERKALADAKARLMTVWQVLTRTPNPGQLRPAIERTPRRQAGPVAPLSQPVQPVAQAPIAASADDYSI